MTSDGRQSITKLDRREFIKVTGAGALATAGAGSLGLPLAACAGGSPRPAHGASAPDVVVIGAGAFGAWTALHLRELGATVALVDMYGPGNARATSGGETRGVRSSYGDRPPEFREVWTRWAGETIERWKAFDAEWGAGRETPLFFSAGDVILREDWEPFLTDTRTLWEKIGHPHEVLTPDEVAYRWPQINVEGFGVALFEPAAGVVRARRAIEVVSEVFLARGGELRLSHAELGQRTGDRLDDIALTPGESLAAETYVFALGPWFGKQFPGFMANRMRVPIGHVYYYGTPVGDNRFTHPNMPSYNFPGVTGWPCLPSDPRGFRVRTGGRAPEDPDTSVRWIDSQYFERPLEVLQRFPDLQGAPLLETRACHYEQSSSRNWFVDRHPDFRNVWLTGGGNAEGFKFGPVLGRYIAARVLGRDEHPELAEHVRLPQETYEPTVA